MQKTTPLWTVEWRRYSRFTFNRYNVNNATSAQQVEDTEDYVISKVNQIIKKRKYQAKDLKSNKDCHTFLGKHCQLRTYTFQVWEHDKDKCCNPIKNSLGKLPWLLDPVLSADKAHFSLGKQSPKKTFQVQILKGLCLLAI